MEKHLSSKLIFFAGLALAASGLLSAPLALTAGLVFGLCCCHPFAAGARKGSKFLLQASVVAMGFGMNLHAVWRAGSSGLVYTAFTITGVLALGLLGGKLLKVGNKQSFLIAAGTAICGGSAIAAMAPIVDAEEEQIAVSLGTIFVLNSVALLIFPALGWRFHLSPTQFGLWSALAIHDTGSVVGAATRFGGAALLVGTTVKLTRALWILPLSLGTAVFRGRSRRIQAPWFIGLFCLACLISSLLPNLGQLFHLLSGAGKLGLTATLYLIGTGISRSTLKQVGVRPLAQGIILWAIIATTSLWLILHNVIHF